MQKWVDGQLRFDLDIDEAVDDAQERMISPDEARLISETARVEFEELPKDGAAWHADYLDLRQHGWPWRVAAYIAWASSPKIDRKPATIAELASKVLGLRSPRVIYTWRQKYPSLDAVVAMMQAKPLFAHRRDVFSALVQVASEPDYKGHNDRKLFFEMTGDHIPKSKLDLGRSGKSGDLSELSDEELAAMIGGADSGPDAAELAEDIDALTVDAAKTDAGPEAVDLNAAPDAPEVDVT